jgi:tRNA-dihydrouridine synthase
MRLPAEEHEDDLLYFCKRLEGLGVDLVTLHPRLLKEKYGRPPRWRLIKLVRDELSIPVFGNGDVANYGDWKRRRAECDCAGIMLARAAVRSPWVFGLLRGREADAGYSLTVDLLETAERFAQLLKAHQPREFEESRTHRFFFYFCENLSFDHQPKMAIRRAPNADAALEILREYFQACPEDRVKNFI